MSATDDRRLSQPRLGAFPAVRCDSRTHEEEIDAQIAGRPDRLPFPDWAGAHRGDHRTRERARAGASGGLGWRAPAGGPAPGPEPHAGPTGAGDDAPLDRPHYGSADRAAAPPGPDRSGGCAL